MRQRERAKDKLRPIVMLRLPLKLCFELFGDGKKPTLNLTAAWIAHLPLSGW